MSTILKIGFFVALFLSYPLGVIIGFFCGANEFRTTELNENVQSHNPLFDLHPRERFLFIFKNNMMVSFKCMLLGTFSFGICSLIYIFYNGFVLGYIIGEYANVLPANIIIRTTLPHSFEFLGIIIYGYVGFVLSGCLFTKRMIYNKFNLLFFIFFASMILLIAAIIESYVSIPE